MPGNNIKEEVHVLPPDINPEAYVAGLGEQDEKTMIPGIIILPKNGPAKFVPAQESKVQK